MGSSKGVYNAHLASTLRWALAESANHDFPYERIAEGLAADEVDSGMPYRDLSLAKNRTFVKNDAGHIDYLQGYLLRHIHEDRLIGVYRLMPSSMDSMPVGVSG